MRGKVRDAGREKGGPDQGAEKKKTAK